MAENKKYLGFYKVDNSLDLERHSFDGYYPDKDGKEIYAKLRKLPDGECHIYCISECGYQTPGLSVSDLVEDYNDEEIDGCGFWVVYFELPQTKRYIIRYKNEMVSSRWTYATRISAFSFQKHQAKVWNSKSAAMRAYNQILKTLLDDCSYQQLNPFQKLVIVELD